MPDYGPRPRIRRINPMPRIRMRKPSQEKLEDTLMGRLIYHAGNIAGKQAAMTAWNYGLRDAEKLRYIKNFAQDEARNDTYKLLEELKGWEEGFPNVTIEAEKPEEVASKEIMNLGLRQLKQGNI